MNIEEYRAMKAEQERAEIDAQTQHTSTPQAETQVAQAGQVQGEAETTTTPNQDAEVQEPSKEVVTDKPITVEIDGKEVSIDELKNGYLRQSDYTKKTQEVKRKEREAQDALRLIEELQKNPQVAQQLGEQFNLPNLDPIRAEITELENKYYDLLIEKEVNELQKKYGDFDLNEVLTTARDNNLNDLDTAYHVTQSRKGGGRKTEVDIDSLKAQLREELMNELKSQTEAQVDTTTIIQTGGDTSPVRDTTPQLSQQEFKVAKMMGMNPEEYAKWRDIKKKK